MWKLVHIKKSTKSPIFVELIENLKQICQTWITPLEGLRLPDLGAAGGAGLRRKALKGCVTNQV